MKQQKEKPIGRVIGWSSIAVLWLLFNAYNLYLLLTAPIAKRGDAISSIEMLFLIITSYFLSIAILMIIVKNGFKILDWINRTFDKIFEL